MDIKKDDDRSIEELEKEYNSGKAEEELEAERKKKADEGSEGDDGKKKDDTDEGAESGVKRDEETGELIITRPETAEEKAAREAEELASGGEKKKGTPETDQGFVELQKSFEGLSAKYPELAKLIPEGVEGGVKGAFTKLVELQEKVNEYSSAQTRQDEDDPQTRLAREGRLKGYIDAEVTQRLASQGIAVPKDEKEWDTLWDENPGKANRLQRAIESTENEVRGQFVRVQKAVDGQKSHNEKVVDDDYKLIKAEAQTVGLDLKDEDFVKWARAKVKDPSVNEKRHGVDYLRAGSLLQAWRNENFTTILLAVKGKEAKVARKQAVDTLTRNNPKTKVLGASAAGNGRGKREVRIDPNDDSQLDQLNDKQLEEAFYKT